MRRVAWPFSIVVVFSIFLLAGNVPAKPKLDLGPQSKQATGEISVLMVAVRFPDAQPGVTIERIRKQATVGLNRYVEEQSYGLATVKADFRGWVDLPDSLDKYKVSPYNAKVDRGRVRKLIEDAMTAMENDVDFSRYQHMLIIPGVHTTGGKGYGMGFYAANPGMLSGIKRKGGKEHVWARLRSKGGKEFGGGVFVGTENSHLGQWAHDFFHVLGGIENGRRRVPCLYDFKRQNDPSHPPGQGLDEHYHYQSIYVGSWDIMSRHVLKRTEPPVGISAFTKIRLGWIKAEQVAFVEPGDSAIVFLSPLSGKGETLTIKIPLSRGSHYLIENRQPIGYDRALPEAGLLVLKVDPNVAEGAGTVKIMDASPQVPHFDKATWRLDAPGREAYVDESNKIAVIALWHEEGNMGVLVTTPKKKREAVEAARAIDNLLKKGVQGQLIEDCKEAYRAYNFRKVLQFAADQ